jgi:fructokinase
MNRTDRAAPTAYGTGFVALDVVVDLKAGTEARFAGGTCGNVLTILAFLGWRAVPIASLYVKTWSAGGSISLRLGWNR